MFWNVSGNEQAEPENSNTRKLEARFESITSEPWCWCANHLSTQFVATPTIQNEESLFIINIWHLLCPVRSYLYFLDHVLSKNPFLMQAVIETWWVQTRDNIYPVALKNLLVMVLHSPLSHKKPIVKALLKKNNEQKQRIKRRFDRVLYRW